MVLPTPTTTTTTTEEVVDTPSSSLSNLIESRLEVATQSTNVVCTFLHALREISLALAEAAEDEEEDEEGRRTPQELQDVD